MIIKASEVKKMVKEAERRMGKDAIEALDRHVNSMVEKLILQKDGGKKTIDAALVNFVFGKK